MQPRRYNPVVPFTFVTRHPRELTVLKDCAAHYGSALLVLNASHTSHARAIAGKASRLIEFAESVDPTAVYMFVDGFDVIIQRSLHQLAHDFHLYAARLGVRSQELVVTMGERNCWPWPKPTASKTRGISMHYMENNTIILHNGLRLASTEVCDVFERSKGRWKFPNAGVFLGSGRGIKLLARCYENLLKQGHFDDQGMMGLCVLQHPYNIRIDVHARFFLSHYAYDVRWFSAPACKTGYLDASGDPPYQLETGRRPFALHFNGPSGKYRMQECMDMFSSVCNRTIHSAIRKTETTTP